MDPSTTTSPAPEPVTPNPSDWRTHLSDELKADPIVKGWSEKASEKDIGSVIKSLAHAQHKMGTAVNLPGKDAKPEDVTAFKQKLIDSGVLPAPPKDVSFYGTLKPEKLPDGLQWDDATASAFANTLLKHGASKELAQELLALHEQVVMGQQKMLATTAEESTKVLKAEFGDKYDEYFEAANRLAQAMFKTEEEITFFNETGIGRSPSFLAPLMRLAPLAMQDSSFVDSLSKSMGEITGHAALAEYTDIMSNPKNPMHEGYNKSDPNVMAHISELYRKAYPNAGAIDDRKSMVATAS